MAKFCNQCGKPLEEGQVCSCQTQATPQSSIPVTPQPTMQPTNFGGYTGTTSSQVTGQMQNVARNAAAQGANVFQKLVTIFKSPICGTKQIADGEDMVSALSMVITNILVMTIITLISCLAINSELGSFFKLPTAKITLTVLLVTAGVDFALATCLWVSAKFIFKENVSFIKILSVTGAKLLIDSVFILVGSILMIVSAKLGLLIFALGSVFTLVLFIQSFYEVSELEEDKKFYAMTIGMIIFSVLVALFTLICLKDFKDTLELLSNFM